MHFIIRRSKDLHFAMKMHRMLIGTDPYKDLNIESNVWYAKRRIHSDLPIAYATSLDNEEGGWSYLNSCGVLAIARGHGLQKRLIRARVQHANRLGLTPITYTLASNSYSVNNLVDCGFRAYNPSYPWIGEDNVVYWIRK